MRAFFVSERKTGDTALHSISARCFPLRRGSWPYTNSHSKSVERNPCVSFPPSGERWPKAGKGAAFATEIDSNLVLPVSSKKEKSLLPMLTVILRHRNAKHHTIYNDVSQAPVVSSRTEPWNPQRWQGTLSCTGRKKRGCQGRILTPARLKGSIPQMSIRKAAFGSRNSCLPPGTAVRSR